MSRTHKKLTTSPPSQNTLSFSGKFATYVMLLLVAILWFGGIEWLFPRYFLWDDNATYSLPYYLTDTQALLKTHVLPIINFFQFGGWNHLSSGQLALYPPTYLAAWFASDILHNPSTATHAQVDPSRPSRRL